jgi:hypothetical protein
MLMAERANVVCQHPIAQTRTVGTRRNRQDCSSSHPIAGSQNDECVAAATEILPSYRGIWALPRDIAATNCCAGFQAANLIRTREAAKPDCFPSIWQLQAAGARALDNKVSIFNGLGIRE